MTSHDPTHNPQETAAADATLQTPGTRRQFLGTAAATALVLGSGNLLAACGGDSSSSTQTQAASTAVPKRGGALRVGLSGGGSGDSLNPLATYTTVDGSRAEQLFNQLVTFDKNALPQLELAEEVTPNKDATVWTIRVRPDVTFHNGKPLTADDVIYTYRLMFDPKAPLPGAGLLGALDVKNMKKLDKLTVQMPCKTPFSSFYETLAAYYTSQIVPVGFDVRNPVGTGPFKYQSFTPGQESVFVRNENYWKSGLPYFDKITITDFADETSQINALVGGQVDAINGLTTDGIAGVTSGGAQVLVSTGGGFTPFTMRTDQQPFSDVRVRQAIRLVVDRQQMLDVMFSGHGGLGNDVFGRWDPFYAADLPQRVQDIDQAKSLLSQAGHAGLNVELATAPITADATKAAQIFAQQANAAGVKVKLNETPVGTFFGAQYLKWTFAQSVWVYVPYLAQVAFSTLPTSPFPETHFDNPKYTALYNEALATLDSDKRKELVREMQQIDYDEGGYIIPYFPPVIDGFSKRLSGDVPSKSGVPFNVYGFESMWFNS